MAIAKPAKLTRIHPHVLEGVRAHQPYRERSQAAFAAALGIGERTLRRWESVGAELRAGPMLEKLRELATRADRELEPPAAVLRKIDAAKKREHARRARAGYRLKVIRRHA